MPSIPRPSHYRYKRHFYLRAFKPLKTVPFRRLIFSHREMLGMEWGDAVISRRLVSGIKYYRRRMRQRQARSGIKSDRP